MTTISTSPPSFASDEVARRLHAVRQRIERAGGDPDRVRVIAVTKGFGIDAVRAALDAGLHDVGENYAAELVAKASDPDPLPPGVVWHFLGAVQRNKVAQLAPIVGLWQSVAREAEGARIARFAPAGRESSWRSRPRACRAATGARRRRCAIWWRSSGTWASTCGAS